MISGDLSYIDYAGVRRIIHINGGHITSRREDQKPYEAKELGSTERQRYFSAIYPLIDSLPQGDTRY